MPSARLSDELGSPDAPTKGGFGQAPASQATYGQLMDQEFMYRVSGAGFLVCAVVEADFLCISNELGQWPGETNPNKLNLVLKRTMCFLHLV